MKGRVPSRVAAIDSLRGLAALAVVFHHMRVDLWVGSRAIWAAPRDFSLVDRLLAVVAAPCLFLGAGVMLFFVISGFCDHLPQVGRNAGEISWAAYIWRRSLRIVPVYWAAVALTWLVEMVGMRYFGQTGSSGEKLVSTVFFAQNYGPEAGQMAANPSLWSLPVEVEFYVVYPLLILLGARLGRRALLALVAMVGTTACGLAVSVWPWLSGNFAAYWPVWCAGALLAERWKEGTLPRLPVKLVMGLTISGLALPACWGTLQDWPGMVTAWLWGGAFVILLWVVLQGGFRLPGERFLGWVGRISYSLYLIHFPVFRLLGGWWVHQFGGKPASLFVPLAASGLILPIAWVFYKVVEEPSHRLARRLAGKGTRALAVPLVASHLP